jgi:hypothetical protein
MGSVGLRERTFVLMVPRSALKPGAEYASDDGGQGEAEHHRDELIGQHRDHQHRRLVRLGLRNPCEIGLLNTPAFLVDSSNPAWASVEEVTVAL